MIRKYVTYDEYYPFFDLDEPEGTNWGKWKECEFSEEEIKRIEKALEEFEEVQKLMGERSGWTERHYK